MSDERGTTCPQCAALAADLAQARASLAAAQDEVKSLTPPFASAGVEGRQSPFQIINALRAELATAKAEVAKQELRYTTDPAFGMRCVIDAERYDFIRSHLTGYSSGKTWVNPGVGLDGGSGYADDFDKTIDDLIARQAEKSETAPGGGSAHK